MSFRTDLGDLIARALACDGLDVEAPQLPATLAALSDDALRAAFGDVAAALQGLQRVQAVLAGVIAQRSAREAGHGGFAATGGFRTPVQLVQEITGVTKGEAVRVVRVGESLLEGTVAAGAEELPVEPVGPVSIPWHRPLREALLAGLLTQAQHDAIRMGLGAPPVGAGGSAELPGRDDEELVEAWRAAASALIVEARECTVEQLAAQARSLRDLLDPVTAEQRFAKRFENRSFRMRTDAEGVRHGHFVLDDETAAWWDAIIAAALRPRRGGPRFVAEGEREAAKALTDDPRTNDQLAYDLFTDLVRVGALATSDDVFGARQPGVRLVAVKDAVTGEAAHRDAFGRLLATAHTEDGGVALPGSVLERALCVTGGVVATVDTCGNPLDLGREQRLFSAKQKAMLALRDGGCVWPGCDRPPSACEAHHADHWAEGGRTDVDRGVLLCAFHHVHLHFAGWHIEREGRGRFVLVPPAEPGAAAGDPIELRSKSPLRWIFDPPPERPGWRTAA